MIVIKQSGNFKHTESFFKRMLNSDHLKMLNKYGELGVQALSEATPKDSGETSRSWDYQVKLKKHSATISWTNSNIVDGVPVVILLQYGHGNQNGSFVQGTDFINPVMKPIFDGIADDIWKEVTRT